MHVLWTLKPGKTQEFFKALKEEILPVLSKYEVVDLILLEPETEPTKVLVISFWQSKAAVETYEKEHTRKSGPFWSH